MEEENSLMSRSEGGTPSPRPKAAGEAAEPPFQTPYPATPAPSEAAAGAASLQALSDAVGQLRIEMRGRVDEVGRAVGGVAGALNGLRDSVAQILERLSALSAEDNRWKEHITAVYKEAVHVSCTVGNMRNGDAQTDDDMAAEIIDIIHSLQESVMRLDDEVRAMGVVKDHLEAEVREKDALLGTR